MLIKKAKKNRRSFFCFLTFHTNPMIWRLLFCALVISFRLEAQEKTDTTKLLEEVVVNAYQYNRSLKESPVALGIATEKEFNRFSNSSIVSTMNTIPGVRMEERSP